MLFFWRILRRRHCRRQRRRRRCRLCYRCRRPASCPPPPLSLVTCSCRQPPRRSWSPSAHLRCSAARTQRMRSARAEEPAVRTRAYASAKRHAMRTRVALAPKSVCRCVERQAPPLSTARSGSISRVGSSRTLSMPGHGESGSAVSRRRLCFGVTPPRCFSAVCFCRTSSYFAPRTACPVERAPHAAKKGTSAVHVPCWRSLRAP